MWAEQAAWRGKYRGRGLPSISPRQLRLDPHRTLACTARTPDCVVMVGNNHHVIIFIKHLISIYRRRGSLRSTHPDPDRVNEIIPNSGQEGCCVEILYTLVPKVGQADLHGSKHKNNIWLTTIPFFYFPSLNSSSLFPEFYFHYLPGINDHQNLDHHHEWSWSIPISSSSSSLLPSWPTSIVTKIHLFNTSPLHPHKFQWLVRVSKLLNLG